MSDAESSSVFPNSDRYWSLTNNPEMSVYRKQTQEGVDSSSYPKRVRIGSSEGLEGIAEQGNASVVLLKQV